MVSGLVRYDDVCVPLGRVSVPGAKYEEIDEQIEGSVVARGSGRQPYYSNGSAAGVHRVQRGNICALETGRTDVGSGEYFY